MCSYSLDRYRADIAMYKAKHENSCQGWYIFNPRIDDDTLAHREELDPINWMRTALNSGFELVIQPIAQTKKTPTQKKCVGA